MLPLRRLAYPFVLATVVTHLAAQGRPIGFEETFALAADRAAAVATLIPGSDDWYYYHCRERLDARDFDAVRAALPAWIQRHGRSQRVIEIENREALLAYERDPERTFEFLRQRLGLRFDHQRAVPGQRSALPSQLDPALLSAAALTERAFALHPGTVDGFLDAALPALARASLDNDQLHSLLARLQRADVDNLPALVVRDLDHRQSRGFGSLNVHGRLTVAQLEECVRLRPSLLGERPFVDAYLTQLQPGRDIDWRLDPGARATQLARLWSFAQRLSPSFNSLKAHVLYHWLSHDLTQGAPDRDRFFAYIRLPRRAENAAQAHLRRHQRAEEFVDAASRFPTGLPPIDDDRALVRACLEHFFAHEDGYEAYAEFLDAAWLRAVLAETKLLLGQGDLERWYSMLPDPSDADRIEQRVELEFAPTSRTRYAADDPVVLELDVKNVPTLLLKVFGIDAFRYHVEQQREVDESIELDGVVANHEQTFTFPEPPLRRVRRTFELPMLERPGTYVVEFVGNGISSRAVVHKGSLRCVERTGAAGHLFRVYDEAGAHRPRASIWFGGRDYTADAQGDVLLPFTTDSGSHKIVLHEGERSSLASFLHEMESYALHAGVHVEREALVAGSKARLLVRPQLRLRHRPVSLQLLQRPILVLTATDLDGLATTHEVRDLQLADDREFVHDFPVPERLVSLRVQLRAVVEDLAGETVELATTPVQIAVNGMDRSDATTSVLPLRTVDGYLLEARGKNGEPKPGLACHVKLHHIDYRDWVEIVLQTDAAGRIALGELPDVDGIEIAAGAFTGTFSLETAGALWPSELHGLAGETLRLPYTGAATAPTRAEFSLMGNRSDEFHKLAIADGFLELRGLEPGDHHLTWHTNVATVAIRITEGKRDGAWLVGRERMLEATDHRPLHLRGIDLDGDALRVRVANATGATRVHVTATRFLASFPMFADVDCVIGTPREWVPTPPVLSSHHSGRQIGDEYRYVLERRFAAKYPGNMLRRPSLLLHPWALEKSSWNDAVGLGGGKGGAYGGPSTGRGGRIESGGERSRWDTAAGEFANLDYLPAAAPLLANLRPDADGIVRVPLAELGDGQIVHVVAIDGDQIVHDSLVRDEKPLTPRERTLRQALDGSATFAEQKRIEFVDAGGEALFADARSAQVEVYDSLGRVHRLLATLTGDPDLSRFAFVVDWPRLDNAQKRDFYSDHACHELHFFLHQKDPAFFDAVVRPLLADKLDKTFLDHWLLGDDLAHFLEPWAFAQLNLIERILLARRLDETGRASIARSVREMLELQRPSPQRLDELFRAALRGRQLDARTSGDDFFLGVAEKVAPPGAAAPAPAPTAPEPSADARDAAPEQDVAEKAAGEQLGRELARREEAKDKRLYRSVRATQLFVERNYWRRTMEQTTPDVVAPSRFWVDYATAAPGEPFFSSAFVEAGNSFLEAMFALAVLDLPFQAGEHTIATEGDGRRLRAASPLLLVRQEVTRIAPASDAAPLLVGQNFYRLGDRYRFVDGERRDAFVSGEFLADTGYGCQVVVTNPTSQKRHVELLLQIPAGSLPLNSGSWTRSVPVELEPYATATVEYAFYFPAPGDHAHYPVTVAERGQLAAAAEPRTLHVVTTPSSIDTSSWEHVSQLGSAAEVLAHVDAANVRRLDLDKVAWRMRDREFFTALLARLRERHAYDHTLWSYGVLHRDAPATREFLQHADRFVADCGLALRSPLLDVEPVERKLYEHVEFDPLVHQRAHRFGDRRVIGNAELAEQYLRLMRLLGYRERQEADEWIAVTYHLLLQDRIEEALASYARIDAAAVTTKLQYDYLTAYVCFHTGDHARARTIAERHRAHPVAHWQQRFAEVLAQLDEAEGRRSPGAGGVPVDLAATAPSLELALDGHRATIVHRNLPQCELRCYVLDVEFAFSARPFAAADGSSAAYVQPSWRETRDLPSAGGEVSFDLPEHLRDRNVLVEVRGGGLVRSRTYFANALRVRFLESWGQVAVSDAASGAPLSKAYVKVFARLPGGQVQFHKDGYTDLRGRFDYASVSDDPNAGAEKYAVLVLDEQRGAVIRELTPPAR